MACFYFKELTFELRQESDLEGQIQALQEEKLDRQHQQDILVLLFDKAKRDRGSVLIPILFAM